MFSRTLDLFLICGLIFSAEAAPAVSKARQFLPALPGYVPVYIRPGDTPLEDINPDLAEAFSSYARKNARLSFGRAEPVFDGKIPSNGSLNQISDIDDVNFQEENLALTSTEHNLSQSQHIQKIPKN